MTYPACRVTALLRAIRTTLRRRSPEAPPNAQLGAVSFFHRFGSSLDVHPHYHLIVLDGVFGEDGSGEIEFHEAYELTTEHIRQVESVPQRRVLRYFRRHGLLDELDAAGMLHGKCADLKGRCGPARALVRVSSPNSPHLA